jgi:ABC-type antimicrobial peptide transport system permease subunit
MAEILNDARRAALALVGISLSCLALTSIASLTWHLREIVTRSEQNSGRIVAVVSRESLLRAPGEDFFLSLSSSVARIDGVQHLSPRIVLPYRLEDERTELSAPELIIGSDLARFPPSAFAERSEIGGSNGVIVGCDAAAVETLRLGDAVSLYGNLFFVSGILRKRFTTDDLAFLIPVPVARRLLPQLYDHRILDGHVAAATFTALEIEVAQGRESSVLRELNEIANLSARDPRIEVGTMKAALGVLKTIAFGAVSITMLCSFAGIANVMFAAISARRRDIGLRRALGARRDQIFLEVLAEGVILGTGSSLCGILLAIIVASVLFPVERTMGTTALFSVSPVAALVAVSITIVCSAGAGLLPAREAAALTPASALREA